MVFNRKDIYILVFLLVVACKRESSQTYVPTNDISVPTEQEAGTIDSTLKEQEKIVAKSTPQSVIKKREDIREEKLDNSIFRKEGCCDSEAPPAVCCCEPVLLKYLELLKSGDAKKIAKVRSEDPILNDCYKRIPSFKKKIDSLEMSGEEED